LNEIEPFDWHEKLVFSCVSELEELLRRVGDADLPQSDEQPDAVIDMDDEVADLQIA
jgi:hypothetical protein